MKTTKPRFGLISQNPVNQGYVSYYQIWRERLDAGKLGKKYHQETTKLLNSLQKIQDKKLNEQANELHAIAFEQIDCLNCANCCKSLPARINDTDINRIAKKLRMKPDEFRVAFTFRDEDGDMVINQSPCPFLEVDNTCRIYEVRPKACREYPHTDQYTFRSNISLHAVNAVYCPAVYHILENFKLLRLKD